MTYKIKNDLGRWVLPRDVVRILGKEALETLKAKGVLHACGRTLFLVKEPANNNAVSCFAGGVA